eukprot:scaffold63421_cov60-Phaeocystis_antarctica.AAC.5
MMDGVVRAPSAFSITLALPPSITATHELVVPRSMPMTSPMGALLRARAGTCRHERRPADPTCLAALDSIVAALSATATVCSDASKQKETGRGLFCWSGTSDAKLLGGEGP